LRRKGGGDGGPDVVGPICESGDYFAKDRAIGEGGLRGDHLALLSAGAYGFVMASNYNSRSLAAEVFGQRQKIS